MHMTQDSTVNMLSVLSLMLFMTLHRAAAMDRGIYAESEKAGLRFWEVEGTRQSVGGGLEGAIYSFQHQ